MMVVFHFTSFCRNLMECFRRRELLNWKEFQEMYTAILREGTPEEPCTGVFSPDEQGNQHWNDFHKKLIEHVREYCR
jgi:hypothetical protein